MPGYSAMDSGNAINVEPLISIVRDPETTPESLTKHLVALPLTERLNAATILGTATDYSVVTVPPLIVLLEDESEQVRAEAASALVRLGELAISPLLLSLASKDVTVDDQIQIGKDRQTVPMRSDYIAWVLINTRAAVEQPLVDFFRDEFTLAEQTQSEEPEGSEKVPKQHLRLFNFILSSRSVRSLPIAIALLDDKDPDLRSLGRSILDSIGDAGYAALPALERAIARSDEVSETVYVVGRIGGPAQPMLRKWLEQHPNPNVRVAAAKMIDGDADGITALLRTIGSDPENQVKAESLERLSLIEHLPEAALKPILTSTETPEMRHAAFRALSNVEAADSAWQEVMPLLINLLDSLPLKDDNFETLENFLVHTFEKLKIGNVQAYNALIQRIEKKVAAGRSWDTAGLLLAATAVKPIDQEAPSELLDKVFEKIPLRRVPDFYPILTSMNPKQIDTAKIREQLRFGLERKFLKAMEDKKTQDIQQSHFYDILDYERATAKTIEVLASIDPYFAETISSFLNDMQKKPEFKDASCNALKWAIVPDEDASTNMPWQTQLMPIWAKDCQPAPIPRPNITQEELISKIVVEVKQAEKQAKRDESDNHWQEEWVATDKVLKVYLKDVVSGSPNESEILASLNAQEDLNRSKALIEHIESTASRDPILGAKIGQQLPELSWNKIIRFLNYFKQPHSLGDLSGIAIRLLQRIAANEKDFEAWSADHRDDIVDVVAKLLEWAQPKQAELQILLVELIRSPEPKVRYAALLFIGDHRNLTASLGSSWIGLLNDSSEEVSVAAASTLISSGEMVQEWDAAASIAISYGLRSDMRNFLDEIADYLRPSHLVSAPGYLLPSFPWPPPRYANRAKFGQDIDLSLICGNAATLGSVHSGLLAALKRVDPNFESGLFSAPGGFAMLTKIEQTDKDGRPLTERWFNYRKPPSSMSEYLVSLFLSPPGYYRIIAFVFTDNSDFGSSDQALPEFREGGLVLPPEIADISLSSRHGFVLVYAFERRDMGAPRPYTVLSAAVHLTRSGLLPDLQTR
ncbi:armadillo/beta-catenin-like repeat family protein [Pseudomonas fluorescens]|uniref:Armadillo/beta-catenin-like repeat family protein n=1 Tax=Pseudomonas fluorescens TaxID=294 RepID=A0A0P8X7A0_PSEFL|nr:HEAT repeat domain-containing protein [Pseudomonas fluorescens]KPU61990.1 armadillo/beta-catenin-like repeat family protein [Pseudomonas fluorescens]